MLFEKITDIPFYQNVLPNINQTRGSTAWRWNLKELNNGYGIKSQMTVFTFSRATGVSPILLGQTGARLNVQKIFVSVIKSLVLMGLGRKR